MPRLIIDNLEIEVPRGTKVIEAAEKLGIVIPRFCFHPSLGSLGACRMCAVLFLEGPVKGIEMSCMEEAKEGMVVSTTAPEAVDFRRQVIEWLMINHPHDCPVCDEGGHCLLQDLTVAGGHGIRRYPGRKRTYVDQDLGVFIRHEMNRCIHCYRCRRFYQEFSGYRDFGALQIGSRMYFGRQSDGPLESPFSGNIIDLCPTGALTDKPSRYKGRRWDYERSPSLCIHCSLGCRVVASVRYREVVRLEAGFSPAVNGYFLCDRGRYGFDYSNHTERPRRARIGQTEVPFDQAIQKAAERISQLARHSGKEGIGCQGSGRSSLETQGMLRTLSRIQGWMGPAYLADPFQEETIKKVLSGLSGRVAVSLREVEQADFILVVGSDPVNESPMLALALRQAFRKGASVTVLDPRPVFLPLNFEHLAVTPDELGPCLAVLFKGSISQAPMENPEAEVQRYGETLPAFDLNLNDRLRAISKKLTQSRRPVIVCGTDVVRENTPALAAELVLLLKATGKTAGLFYVLKEANTFGAALLSSGESTFLKILEAIEKETVTALVLVENDPFRYFPDHPRLEEALKKLDLLLVMDYLPSPAARLAGIFLPTQTLFEVGGTYVNQEGRAQWVPPVFSGGLPMEQISGGGHPPRLFRRDIPGGEPKPAGQILMDLGRSLSPEKDFSIQTLWGELAREYPAFSNFHDSKDQLEGTRIIPEQVDEKFSALNRPVDTGKTGNQPDSIELLLVDKTFGTEELSAYSRPAREAGKRPYLTMATEIGRRIGLQTRDHAVLTLDNGELEVEVELNDQTAPGVMILPRHDQIAWQKMAAFPIRLTLDRIEKKEKKNRFGTDFTDNHG